MIYGLADMMSIQNDAHSTRRIIIKLNTNFILRVSYIKNYYMAGSGVLIGYPSGQEGPMLPARDCPLWSREKKLLDAGFHSSLPLQNETIYKTRIITGI